MQQVIVDCTTGVAELVDLTPEEIADLQVHQAGAQQQEVRGQIAAHEDEYERAQAIKNLLLSPVVASDPALAQALSYVLGV